MKLLLSFALSLLTLTAQTVDSSPRGPAVFTVSTLPTASSWTNKVALVTDGNAAGDCTTGGGSTRVLCASNGTVWAAVAGGGGGGTTNTTPSICPGGCAGSYPSGLSATANTVYLWLVNVPGPTQFAKIVAYYGNSLNHAWALYSTAGNLLATSGTWAGCGGCFASTALSYTTGTGAYYLAFSVNTTASVIAVSGTTWPVNNGTVTTPKTGTAANASAWSGATPNFPSTLGTITAASFGYPYVDLTY